MKEENTIDKLFREKLEGFSESPPGFVWDGIQDTLAGNRRKRRIAWYSWSAVAALLVLAFIAGWYLNESPENIGTQLAGKEIIPSQDRSASGNEEEQPENATVDSRKFTDVPEKEFLAETEDAEKEDIKAASGNEPGGKSTGIMIATLERFLPPEELKALEASVFTQSSNEFQTNGLPERENSGVTPYEKEVIRRNATLLADAGRQKAEWKMGVNVSPGYSSYSAKYSNAYASNMTNESDEGNASLGGGISVRVRAAKRWSLESGIYYAQNGQQTGSSPHLFSGEMQADYAYAPERLYFNTAVKMEKSYIAMNSTAGIIEIENLPAGAEIAANLENSLADNNSLITQGEFSQVFDLVEIPLYLRYLVIDSKLDVELLGGVNAGVVVGNNAFLDNQYGVQKIGRTRDISTMNISGTMGLGFNYAMGKRFSLSLEPRFNYYLNSLSRNPEVEFKPYRVGIYTGLYYSF